MDVSEAGNLTSTRVYYMYQVSTYPLMLSALLRLRRITWLSNKVYNEYISDIQQCYTTKDCLIASGGGDSNTTFICLRPAFSRALNFVYTCIYMILHCCKRYLNTHMSRASRICSEIDKASLSIISQH